MKMGKGSLSVGLVVAGIAGALTNTILVMGGIYVMFRDSYATAVGVSVDTLFKFIMGIVAGNGIPEALVAGVITVAVGQVLYRIRPVTA